MNKEELINRIFVKLITDAQAVNRTLAFGSECVNPSMKEVGFAVMLEGKKFNKTEKEEDKLVTYIDQQHIVLAFVEILKRSSIFAMLSSHTGNSFDHLITAALREMDYAVDFK